MAKKEKAGLHYLDEVIRSAYGTHRGTVRPYTKYTSIGGRYGIQQGAIEGGGRIVQSITEASTKHVRDTSTGKPASTSRSFIDFEDAKTAVQKQIKEQHKAVKQAVLKGVSIGEGIGATVANQKNKVKTAEAVTSAFKTGAKIGMKQGIRRGAYAMFGPAAGFALGAKYLIGKGYKRAMENPEFHKGKPGSHYLDVSVNKPGKYGIDY